MAPPKGAAAAAAAAAAPAAAKAAVAPAVQGGGRGALKAKFTDVENGPIRKIIAARLLESKTTIPHMCAPCSQSALAVCVRESERDASPF